MLFAVGTKVRLKNTGDEGVITEMLGEDMFTVHLTEMDMEIPAFENNLERIQGKKNHIAKFVQGKAQKRKIQLPPADSQYTMLTNKGILLAFDPQLDFDDSISHYDVHLINATPSDVIFTFELRLNNSVKIKINAKTPSASVYHLGELLYNQLNEVPVVAISCWKVTTAGTEAEQQKSLKLKPKTFFTKIATAPLLDKQVHLFTVFKNLTNTSNKKPTKVKQEDLSTYTKRNTIPKQTSNSNKLSDWHDVKEFAEFIPEIDLHIDKLVGDVADLNKADILRIQLSTFDQFLAKAIRLGVERVFAIHGIGKGKLRDAIAGRLIQNSDVNTFKNEYHPRYGWGATEIILK